MIRYALRCGEGHQFDSWFKSAAAFDGLAAAGHLSCAVCGSDTVRKALMAPRVTTAEDEAPAAAAPEEPSPEEMIARMRKHVEETATYVGGDFASRARAMHEGHHPLTQIWGEANGKEAKSLIEDGVPVLPLPFKPRQKLQ